MADTYSIRKKALEDERSKQTVIVRGIQDKLHAVQSSISLTEDFAKEVTEIPVPEYAEVCDTHCPFCHTPNEQVEQEANKLTAAIGWMNRELRTSSYARESFRDEESKLIKLLAKEKEILSSIKPASISSPSKSKT